MSIAPSLIRLHDPGVFERGLVELGLLDPAVAAAIERLGPPPQRRWEPGFPTLVNVIIGQQVSTASARAIRDRLLALINPLTPEGVLEAGEAGLRSCGFSRQKIAYSLDLAARTADGRVEFDRFTEMGDADVIAELTAVKGIGTWTAEIYLLFALGRPDIWPGGDLALQLALQHIRGWGERPSDKIGRAGVESWAPWRGVGAHLMWHYYHALTKRDVTTLGAKTAEKKPTAKKASASKKTVAKKPVAKAKPKPGKTAK